MGFRQERNVTGVRRFWPVLGFIMLVALGIISYFLAPAAIAFAIGVIPGFRGNELSPAAMQVAFTVLIFVILGSFGVLLLALARPRQQVEIKDSDLVKTRDAMRAQKVRERQRMRKINRELRGK